MTMASSDRRNLGRIFLIVGLATACLSIAGCGNRSREESAQGTAQQYLVAVTQGDSETACTLLAPRAKESLTPTNDRTCAEALTRLHLPPPGAVTAFSIWDTEAQAKTTADTLFLHEFSTGWHITGAGCQPSNNQVYSCEVGGP